MMQTPKDLKMLVEERAMEVEEAAAGGQRWRKNLMKRVAGEEVGVLMRVRMCQKCLICTLSLHLRWLILY